MGYVEVCGEETGMSSRIDNPVTSGELPGNVVQVAAPVSQNPAAAGLISGENDNSREQLQRQQTLLRERDRQLPNRHRLFQNADPNHETTVQPSEFVNS